MQYVKDALNVQLILVFLLVFLGVTVVYGKWKKPKKKLPPGPMGLPIVGYLPFLGLEPHQKLIKLGKKYGNVMGMNLGSKYTVILNEYTVMKEALTNAAALDRAPHLFDHIPRVGFITANGHEWQEQRRFCLQSTRDLGLGKGGWESLVLDEVSSYMEELYSYNGSPLDISHSLGHSITSNIISLLIGRRLKKGEEDDKVQLSVDFSDVSFTYMGPSNVASVIPRSRRFLEMFRIAGYDRAARIINKFCDFVKEEVSRHKTDEFKDLPDFINSYITKMSVMSDNVRHYFNEPNLEGNLNILFLAASDTIFSSLGWLLRLMAHHKDIQKRVYQELMEVLGPDGVARYEERNKFPYTFAVLMESQRFSSIVPLSTTRRANQDISVGGYTIPKGAELFANLWALHNDPDYWDEPEKFKPERFLENDGVTLVKQPKSYAPFSIGRRNCPGETIAWMEVLGYFSEIIRKFEIAAPPNEALKFDIVNGLVSHLVPQALCFIKRES